MIKVDGKYYASESDVPEMGSVICVGVEGNKRQYEFNSADLGKLPTDCGAGSTAWEVDTGTIYKLDKKTNTWIAQA